MHVRNLKIRYFEKALSKNLLKVNLIFSFTPSSFYEQNYEKQNEHGTSYQSLFGLQNIFRNSFSVIYLLGNFDDLIQSGFQFIPKIIFANLCKPVHDVIIIPVSSDALNLENV